MKDRVHELAKEFGVPAKEVLAELSALGEFVKSASSTLEAPVARRLRERFRQRPVGSSRPRTGRVSPPEASSYERPMYANDGTPGHRPQLSSPRTGNHPVTNPGARPRRLSVGNHPFGVERPGTPSTAFEPLPMPRGGHRPDYYKGPVLQPLTMALLRQIETDYDWRDRRPAEGRHYKSDVIQAQEEAKEWASAKLDGLVGTADEIAAWRGSSREQLTPEQAIAFQQAGIHARDLMFCGQPSVRLRVSFGNITVAQAIAELRATARSDAGDE